MLTDKAKQNLIDVAVIFAALAIMSLVALGMTGCLSARLQQPAREHSIQLETLCLVAEEEASERLREGVCEAARAACLIEAISRGEDGDSCR